jgi:hypothetical protein
MTHIRFNAIEANLGALQQAFAAASPFEHLVFDHFLEPESLAAVIAAIGQPDLNKKSSDYIFAKNKFEDPDFSEKPRVLIELRDELLSERFARILSTIYGKPLFVDPSFLGGGIHQGGEGSYLDMHADFSRHPANKEWLRELNILLYLNEAYQDAWGGHLDLLHSETQQRAAIAPVANRLVLMLTKGHTLHGYKPINFPPGRFRTSLAGYAYSVNHDFSAVPNRSTKWSPENASAGKTFLARWSPTLVKVKNKLFGSSTERRARKERDRNS